MVDPEAAVAEEEAPAASARAGLGHYREELRRLAPVISPAEAQEARAALFRGLRLLAVVLVVFLGVSFAPDVIDPMSTTALRIEAVLLGVSWIAALVLVTRFRVPWAGRVLFVVAGVLAWDMSPESPWTELDADAVWAVATDVGLHFVFGWLVDYGGALGAEPPRLAWRRAALLVLAAFWFGLLGLFWLLLAFPHVFTDTAEEARRLSEHPPLIGLFVAAAVTAVWGWWPGPRLAARARLSSPPAETALRLAARRWTGFAGGRALALILTAFPLFLLLNAVGADERLGWPPPGSDALRTVLTAADGTEHEVAWYWRQKGGYLAPGDFSEHRLHVVDAATRDRVRTLGASHRDDEDGLTAEGYGAIIELLAPYRVTPATAAARLPTTRRALEAGEVALILASSVEAPGMELWDVPTTFRIVVDLWDPASPRVEPMSEAEVDALLAAILISQLPLLLLSLLAMLILWRRGGDSGTARWIGLWLIGAGIVPGVHYAGYFVDAQEYALWGKAVSSGTATLLMTTVGALELTSNVIAALFALLLPCAAIWVRLCWPARADAPWWSGPGRVALACAAMNAVYHLAAAAAAAVFGAGLIPALVATAALAGVSTLAAVRLRTTEVRLPAVLVGTFFLVQGLALGGATTHGAYAVLTLGLVLAFCYLLLREDFLHIAAAQDLSFLVVYVVLPLIVTWSGRVPATIVGDMAADGYLSRTGATILLVVIGVALLIPVRAWACRVGERMVTPGYRHARRVATLALDRAVETGRDPEIAKRLLRECGVAAFALYRRGVSTRYELVSQEGAEVPQRELELSEPLRRALTGCHHVDLGRIAVEWRWFFHQFELERLRVATQGRRLVPLRAGGGLYGLLVIPDAAQAVAAHDPTARELSDVAAASLLGGTES